MKINKNVNNIRINTLILLVLVIFLTNFSLAARIGVSPASIKIENVLRSGYAEKIITITVDSEDEVTVEAIPRGQIASWINFSDNNFTVTKNAPFRLTLSVSPPSDIPNGNYSGFVRLRTSQEDVTGLEGYATGIIKPVLDLYTEVFITDIEYFECKATGFSVDPVEIGDPLKFRSNILNLGNTQINPRVQVDIWDFDQIELLKSQEFSTKLISPTTTQEVEVQVDTKDLDIGQYWVDVSTIDCYSQETLTFDVLAEGALHANGKLLRITTVPWVDIGDTTIIEAHFVNNGEKEVSAYFKGKIMLGEKIIQLIESEKTDIRIGDTNVFEYFFTPTQAGRYIVSGRIHYDSKKTFEKAAVINVKPTKSFFKAFFKYLIYIVLISGIIFLSIKIRKLRRLRWIKNTF